MFAGIDSQKATLAVAIVDDAGRLAAQFQTASNSRGHDQLVKALANVGVLRVGVDGSGGMAGRLRGAACRRVGCS
jgi:hypothetical protein